MPKQDQMPVVKCKICGKPHLTYKYWHDPDNKKVASSAEFNSQYRGDNLYRDQDRKFGHSVQRDNYYDNNYRIDHQVNFCKSDWKCLDVGKFQAKLNTQISSKGELTNQDSNGTCQLPRSRLPIAVGTVNGKPVRVLRNTGRKGVVFR